MKKAIFNFFQVIVTGHTVIDNSCLTGRAYIHSNAKFKDFDHSYCCLNVGGDIFIDSNDTFDQRKALRIHCEQMEMCEVILSIVYYWLWHGIAPYGFEENYLFASPAEASKTLENFLLSSTTALKMLCWLARDLSVVMAELKRVFVYSRPGMDLTEF